MTLQERADAYNETFPDRPPMHANDRWLEGTWIGGNNYKGSGYYGAYPPDYLERVRAVFQDLWSRRILHLFSGSLDAGVSGIRVDLRRLPPFVVPDVQANALCLPFSDSTFDLVIADTPYGEKHAAIYGTKMPSRRLVLYEAARVTRAGGMMVWLDTKLPMFSKSVWHWCGVITVIRSTNHDVRGAFVFLRIGGDTK